MNYSDVNNTTRSALKKSYQRSIFANNWEASGKLLSSLAIPKKAVKDIGGEDSFLQRSQMFNVLLDQVDIDELSLADLTFLSQAAKAIEDGDSKAATFIRDTSGGKPVDKQQQIQQPLTDLPDNAIDYLIEHGVIDDEQDS